LALKIPLLLVQFLYKNRKLALPGIGIFTLDKSIVLPQEGDQDLLALPNGIRFQEINVTVPDKELISFICENTGKIRPLATSDLESYLTLGMEMLNIGKPFYIEGIGTISRDKSGKLEFTPGEYTVIGESPAAAGHPAKGRKPESSETASPVRSNIPGRALVRAAAILIAIVIIGWGGYLMYQKNTPAEQENQEAGVVQQLAGNGADSSALRNDSLQATMPDTAHHTGSSKDSVLYKFVILPTSNKAHALRRYRQLVSFDLKAHLYQKDSSYFKVYFQFPALPKDTVHIKDSLKRQYAHEVTIEE
jgi:hypothetical protein